MAVGELFLSAFIQVLVKELASGAMKALARREKIESHFTKLSMHFSIILAVLDDAEEKQLTDKAVKVWLEFLRDLAYDLDDVLDEICTRYMIQVSKGIHQHRASRVWKLIPTCSSYTPNALISNYRIMSKIKDITKQIQFAAKQKTDLNLSDNSGRSNTRHSLMRLPTTSLVNESQVYGRDEDKEAILEMLRANEASNDKVSVIPIVGMGGIGKTTLAQLVYNDRNIKQNFHVKAWVCVTEDFDVLTITKTIFKSVTDTSGESMDLNMLQVSLQDKLSKSKFLIVLDDVWNEDYDKWYVLFKPLQFGLPGSRVIVTTRNDTVAAVVGSPRRAYHLKLLTDDDCLALLAEHSRKIFQGNDDFQKVGLGLVKRCKGLPLAAKTLGGLLRSKETMEDWEDVLNSKIWDLPEENSILPVLRLSYHHLPSHLKHLFSYCSIFPKDYEFDKNELVYLWMGEGFLEKTNEKKTKEEMGIRYFNELLSRSFFQRLSGCDSVFVMHDLINDLAQFVAGGTSYRLDERMDTNTQYQLPEKVRHASFLRHEYEVFQKFVAFLKVQGLRTFLPMPVQNTRVWPPFYLSNKILVELVPELHRLRVLSLSGYAITEVPSSICNLIHLRYLNLSGTSIVTLPNSLSDLVRLETLSLSNCRFISNLPPCLGNLSNLRHLENSNTEQLKEMPVEIGKLENLQTLPKIVLSKLGGLGLKELRNLKNLRGKLAIFELQNVRDVEDVKEASLRYKELDELQLTWRNVIDNTRDMSSEVEVLDLLEPNLNLKKLNIEFYGGEKFPTWIGDPAFRKLTTVILRGCSECTSLPPLGQLPDLKELHVISMPKIKHIGSEFYGSGVTVPFPKLEILRFNDMIGWEKWSSYSNDEDAYIQFSHLRQFAVLKCQRLSDVSPLSFPVLRELDLEECNMVLLKSFYNLESLIYLKVESIADICDIPGELINSLAALEVLECCGCNELLSIWPSENPLDHLIQLKRLVIADCSQLMSLGEGLPINLEVLELFRCATLTSLPNDLGNLNSLRELIIKNCPKFVNFPGKGIPPMLKRLEILSCNALEALPCNNPNLERLEIKDCLALTTWAMGNLPIDLKKLSIKNCTQLEPLIETMFPEEGRMCLQELSLSNWINSNDLLKRMNRFSNLVELYLSSCDGLRHFPREGLPPRLRSLSVEDCANLKSLPLKVRSTTSLVSLEIRSCPRLDLFPKSDLPPNLTSLKIWDSKKFKPLNEWGLHRLKSLTEFSICGGFKELETLGDVEGLFPPSLITFSIARFPRLTSISKVLDNLTMLRHLSIVNCEKLNDLPCDQVLEKLWHFEISECETLTPKCVKDRGDYWSKISGIPCVEIGGTYVYQQRSS